MILFRDGEPAAAAVGAQPKGVARAPARTRVETRPSALGALGRVLLPEYGTGDGAHARAGSSTRLSTRMPCTKTIAPPSQPPRVSST